MNAEAPSDLGADGLRLWGSVTTRYELEEHELLLLEAAARTADTVARLGAALGDELVDDRGRVRAELVELRQQRIVLARLLAALRVPLGEEQGADASKHDPTPRLQRRSSQENGGA